MRSLPVLLIAIALLPLSTALQCQMKMGDVSKTIRCPADVKFCAARFLKDHNGKDVMWTMCDVADECKKEGCYDGKLGQASVKTCCCMEDFCNESNLPQALPLIEAPPTPAPTTTRAPKSASHLSPLAAAAAVIVAALL